MIGSDYSSNKGFLTIAQNGAKVDYLKLAYAQALSIKLTQTHNQYAVAIDNNTVVPAKYKEVFDHVIELPWGDDSINSEWKLQNEWKTYHVTPFEETIKLDCDMLFLSDILPWWDAYRHYDLCPAINVNSYRGPTAVNDAYRKTFTVNGLPNFYSALFYYRKSQAGVDLFKACEHVYKHWHELVRAHLSEPRPIKSNTDVAFALAAKLIGMTFHCDIGRFVHMKPEMLGISTTHMAGDWTQHLRFRFTEDLKLFVEDYRQTLPFHYQVKTFVSDELIARYEKLLGL